MTSELHQAVLGQLLRQFDVPLIQNNLRGAYVELMVAQLLGDGWRHNGADWGAYDLEHSTGVKLEVKQSAARQTWSGAVTQDRSPTFSIRPPKIEWVGTERKLRNRRIADLYVFAWHGNASTTADHRDETQWAFFVVPADRLPDQQTISLKPLQALTSPVGAGELRQAVELLMRQGVAA